MVRTSFYPSLGCNKTVPPQPSDRAKQYAVYRKILQSRYDSLPPWRAPWREPRNTALSLMRMAFDSTFQKTVVDAPYTIDNDERPDREKLFHRLGTCATCDFVPVADSLFGGILAQTAPGVMRLSLATSKELYAPGIAIKLFRSGGLGSVNLLAAPGLDPQRTHAFFAHAAHTSVPPPKDPLARAFFAVLGGRHPPYSLDLRGATKELGSDARIPRALTFEPLIHLKDESTHGLRVALAALPVGEKLWNVSADGLPVGYIRQTSRFVASSYGDRILHFPHA